MQELNAADHNDESGRLSEVARILATGILRLRARAALASPDPDLNNSEKSSPDGLEVLGQTVLSEHVG